MRTPYFWRIHDLKASMVSQPLSEREVLPYLLLTLGLYAAIASLPTQAFNLWDYLGAAWTVAITVLGIVYVYHRNGGSKGRDFLQRLFAIGWVVTIRWVVFLSLALLLFYISIEFWSVFEIEDETQWHDFAIIALAEIGLYWRMGFHVRDLAVASGDS